jgi:adenine-specific DNA-methyltransferase
LVAAEGRYREGTGERAKERRVAVTIGPEYGTVSYGMVRDAAREAVDGVFDAPGRLRFCLRPARHR